MVPEQFNLQTHILDHAGGLYDWFYDARVVSDDTLVIRVWPESVEYLVQGQESDTVPYARVFSREQVWETIVNQYYHWGGFPDDYEVKFYSDLVHQHWDELDGDMNVIDSLLQRLAFGELVYG